MVKERSEIKRSEISLKLSEMLARQRVPIAVHLNSYCMPTTFLALAGTKPSETRAKFTKSLQSRGKIRQEDEDRYVNDVRGGQGCYRSTTDKEQLNQQSTRPKRLPRELRLELSFILLFYFILFLATLHSLQDLSSPTRDRTPALGSESAES